jgi:hypothetical protein
MRFWILLAAVIGYHIEDVWDYLLIYRHYHPEYPGMVVQAVFCPGVFFFVGLFSRLATRWFTESLRMLCCWPSPK